MSLQRLLRLCLFANFLLFSAYAQSTSTRWIDLEWEEVPNAKGYEVAIFENIENIDYPRGIFHTDIPHWSKESPPGRYNVKIRALDQRNVPGSWGESIPVNIKLGNAQLFRPINNEEFQKNELEKNKIVLEWSKVQGAEEYLVFLYKDNKIFKSEKTKKNEIIFELDEINDYSWIVVPGFISGPEVGPDNDSEIEKRFFSIRGEKLKSPVIEVNVQGKKGIIFSWPEIYRAEDYEINILKITNDQTSPLYKFTTKKTVFGFPREKIPEGKWLYSVVGKSKKYKKSEESRVFLNTQNKATQVTSNESVYKETNYRPLNKAYAGVQIGYPTLRYQNKNYETDTSNSQNLRGIRIMLQSSLPLSDTFNFHSVLTFGQYADSYVDINQYELINGIRKIWGTTRLKFQTGAALGLRSMPFLSSNRLSSSAISDVTEKDFLALFPEINLQLNYKYTEHFELEALAKLDSHVKNLKSSISGEIKKTTNTYFVMKLIYNINSQVNLSGAWNMSNISNQAFARTGSDSFALEGDANESVISSRFVNFGFEYYY